MTSAGRRVAIDDGVLGQRARREEAALRAIGQPLPVGGRDEGHHRGTRDGGRRERHARAAVALGDEALEGGRPIEGVVARAAREVRAHEVVAHVRRLARVLEHGQHAAQRQQRARERRVARRGRGRRDGRLELVGERDEPDVVLGPTAATRSRAGPSG